jgi:hypothetical protein
MNTCTQCDRTGVVFKCNRWLCEIHFRIQCMRDSASFKGKFVPDKHLLFVLAEQVEANAMKCSHCSQIMVWRGEKGQRNVVSLQHDRDGGIRLLCFDCNFNHRYFPGDTFYTTPRGWKYCPKCSTAKPPGDFYRQGNGKLKSYCKACKHVLAKAEWAAKDGVA